MTTPTNRLRAAIIGLGQVGSRFDEEPRESIWSHAGAYLEPTTGYELVAGADPSEDQRQRFQKRCPGARVYADPGEMLKAHAPDVVSVCTPAGGRADLVTRLLEVHHPKVLLCEKPLEMTLEARRRIIDACASAGTHLIVNYTRRYEHVYRAVKTALAEGRVGKLRSITVRAPNRLWTIGCHALDAISFFAGHERASVVHAIGRPSLEEGGEPAADALLAYPDDVVAHLVTIGMKANLLFEIDLIGSGGRIQIVDNGKRATASIFEASTQFVGYETLTEPVTLTARPAGYSPFVELVREAALAARALGGLTPHISSTGTGAMATESLLEDIVNLSVGGAPQPAGVQP